MGLTVDGPSLLDLFAESVGPPAAGPVACAGGKTQWAIGGALQPGTREVAAPAGVVAHEPGEMIVRVRAGSTLAELAEATEPGGQFVAIEADDPERATVGGVLSTGRSGVRRLGWGPVRDTVLEVTAVSARGEVIRAGAPLVKNVTGFDLCRLLVGSLGTLALIGEVVLRCRPRPEVERWWCSAGADPFSVFRRLYRPVSVLWDGERTWVGLAGYRSDVEDQMTSVLGAGFDPVEGPPSRPGPERRSLAPASLASLPALAPPGSGRSGEWLAEIGVGVVHCGPDAAARIAPARASSGVVDLHQHIKERFDPDGRLNPGRSPLGAEAAGAMGSLRLPAGEAR